MRVTGPGGRTPHEGSASPGSASTDEIAPTPPSPCLHELEDDDATPRQQWSPVHTVARARSHPNNEEYHGSTFPGTQPEVEDDGPAKGKRGGGRGGRGDRAGTFTGGGASAGLVVSDMRPPDARPDSPVMRVDMERLDLSVLALEEERSSVAGAGDMNPDTFSSEPGLGQVGLGGRPRSLGGRPSRAHTLFVTPGHLGTGPSSPPSSYSTHSESGFASPTRRVASPGLPREQGRVRKGHWKKGKPIGVGSCGNVYLGMNEDTGELMAVKEITLEAKERLLCSLYNEIQVMHKLVHPHIVGYLGAELQDSQRKLCIFQEWVPAGSLHSLLDQFGALSDAMTRKYTGQVLEGLTYLHANRVIHRDVKSKNILVDDRGNVKLADFGCAFVLKDDNHGGDGVEMSMKGTPLFMAPEMLLKRKCGRRVDVWSLGCAVLEMVTTRPPWADTFKHPVEIIAHFSESPGPPPLPTDLSPDLRDFLLSCFTWDAEVRPSTLELCGHKYLHARAGPPAGGGPGDDVPLEEMDRMAAVTRMRRCSSATLDLLAVKARQAALGVSIGGALAAFGTAPSGTFRPPSPRYGPGGIAAHNKRTPTRRRVYTETGLPPPESLAPAMAGKPAVVGANAHVIPAHAVAPGAELTRRFSMPAGRTPPVSPDKPRRPGRGSGGGSMTEDEGRVSGSIFPVHLLSLGVRIEGTGYSSRSVSSGDSVNGTGTDTGSGNGKPYSAEAPIHNSSGLERAPAAGTGVATSSYVDAFARRAPTPMMPPLVRELLGVTIEDATTGLGGADAGAASDSPPPTVRPLELRRSVSAQSNPSSWPGVAQEEGAAAANALFEKSRISGAKGIWGAAGVMSDVRGGVSSRN